MRRSTFAGVAIAQAATILNRVYEGYVVPMVLSDAQTELHVAANDIVPASSPLWYEGEEVVAAALLGVRGTRGWIGGFGITPPYRGRRLGGELLSETLAAALAQSVKSIQLESLVQNEIAIRVYEHAEFRATRRLNTYRRVEGDKVASVDGVSSIEVGPVLNDELDDVPCWQCEQPSLEWQASRLRAVGEKNAYALFRHNETVAQIVKISVRSGASLDRLVRGIFAATGVNTVVLFNQPEGGMGDMAAREAGWHHHFAQQEMHRSL